MSQSHYHVFLPPTLSALVGSIPRLSFQDLSVPRDVESQLDFGHSSQVSRLKRISQLSQPQPQPQPQPQSRPNGNTQHRQPEEVLIEDESFAYPISLTPTPTATPIASGSKDILKRKVDDNNTSVRGNQIKRSRAPLTLSGHTVDESVEDDPSGSGSRRRSSRVRRSTSGSSTHLPYRTPQEAESIAGLLGTFPDLDSQGDESFLSLNTTISSLPPSGDVASVLNLPKWTIPLTKLSSLPTLLSTSPREDTKVSLIVCVLSVDTPVLRQRKEEKRRGMDGTLWIGGWVVTAPNVWIGYAPEGDGSGCGVKLWGEVARDWGDEVVRKGDVVLLESESFSRLVET
jgi:hypothetical protein